MGLLVAGNNPAAVKTAERNIFTATASQTTFTITQGYQAGDIDVYLNGVRLVDTEDYVANNGTTVVLNSGATVGDSVVVVCFRPFQVADFYTKSEQDTRYVNATGDTITGDVNVVNAKLIMSGAATFPTDTTDVYFGRGPNGYLEIGARQTDHSAAYISFKTVNAERMKIDNAGRVTMQYQPSFYAYHSTSPTPTNSSSFIFDSTNYNSGMYSTSTGRMTAPVTGKYLVSICFRVNSQNAGYYAQTFLYINGAVIHQGSYHGTTMSSGSAGYNSVMYTGVLSLNQNDYVQPYWTVQAGTTNFSGSESWFSGYLLG